MGTAAATRELTVGSYLTDDKATLLYVLDLTKTGETTIENVGTGEVSCIHATKLDGWRFVDPEGG